MESRQVANARLRFQKPICSNNMRNILIRKQNSSTSGADARAVYSLPPLPSTILSLPSA